MLLTPSFRKSKKSFWSPWMSNLSTFKSLKWLKCLGDQRNVRISWDRLCVQSHRHKSSQTEGTFGASASLTSEGTRPLTLGSNPKAMLGTGRNHGIRRCYRNNASLYHFMITRCKHLVTSCNILVTCLHLVALEPQTWCQKAEYECRTCTQHYTTADFIRESMQ